MATPAAPVPGVLSGDIGFMLASTALVFIMIPGLGYFYAGMARDKNALSLMLVSILALAVVAIEWYIWGFSLSFSTTGSAFLGDFQFALLRNVGVAQTVASNLPDLVMCIYQAMFAAITPALAVGAIAERFALGPLLIFIFVWTTLVYNPIAYWTWGTNGWLNKLGAMDFAGGTPVHMTSGFAGLALALFLGKRKSTTEPHKPHSMSSVILGTSLLWFGWMGFNGGSALAANARAANAFLVTNLAACMAGLTWLVMDYIRDHRISALGFCSGAVAGLVAITPASGFVGPSASLAIGLLASLVCFYSAQWKHRFGFDDTLDVFGIHGVGGLLGNFLTGIFAEPYWSSLDGVPKTAGGAIAGQPMQILYQLAAIAAGASWAFCVTYIILFLMKLARLNLRVSEQKEEEGLDHTQIGEYTFDYVGERISSSLDLKRQATQESVRIEMAGLGPVSSEANILAPSESAAAPAEAPARTSGEAV
ncbi:hypothetical protein RI367_001857 [Sorochytrium milnesiophthora]